MESVWGKSANRLKGNKASAILQGLVLATRRANGMETQASSGEADRWHQI